MSPQPCPGSKWFQDQYKIYSWSSIGTRISTILNGENFQRTATVALCLTGGRRTESSKLIQERM